MRRSVSASRGSNNSSAMTSSYHSAAKLVKKSRPTQTSLTKDACHESPDTENPGLVNFQVCRRHDLILVLFHLKCIAFLSDTFIPLERINALKVIFYVKAK